MRVTDRLRRAGAVAAMAVFTEVTLTRAGQERTVTVTLGTLPGT
jgi:hypothetical protein